MQYLRARYYSPETGRFIQKDEYKGDYTSPATLNRFVYCQGNPIKFADPSGNLVTQADVNAALTEYNNQAAITKKLETPYNNAKAVKDTLEAFKNRVESALREAERQYNVAAKMTSFERLINGVDLIQLEDRVNAVSKTLINAANLWSSSIGCFEPKRRDYENSKALEEAAKERYEQLLEQYEIDKLIIQSQEAVANGSANLSQNYWRWVDEEYGNDTSHYGQSGCLPTAIAIAFNYSGKCSQYTPVEVGQVIASHGSMYIRRDEGGTRGYQYLIGGEVDGIIYPDRPITQDFDFVQDVKYEEVDLKLLDAIKNGISNNGNAILNFGKSSDFTASGHYMVAVGYNEKTNMYTLVDPRDGSKKEYTAEVVYKGLEKVYSLVFN